MAKLSLVANPTFQAKVGIPMAGEDAKPVPVMLTFKHRTKSQLTEWLNSRQGKDDAESFLDMVSAWDLEDEFKKENIELLLENYAGTAREVLNVYVDQLFKAKLGN